MNERLKELAEQAGCLQLGGLAGWRCHNNELERFAELVAADAVANEREACAKLCLELVQAKASGESYEDGTIDCAAAIRARSEK